MKYYFILVNILFFISCEEVPEYPPSSCTGMIEIGFYDSPDCTAGQEVNTLVFDISQTCFGWERSAQGSIHQNSATNFIVYKDQVCYTQHVGSLFCNTNAPTDKESFTDTCLQEPTGQALYARILSGTENFPDAPSGFSCAVSATGQGTKEVNPCH